MRTPKTPAARLATAIGAAVAVVATGAAIALPSGAATHHPAAQRPLTVARTSEARLQCTAHNTVIGYIGVPRAGAATAAAKALGPALLARIAVPGQQTADLVRAGAGFWYPNAVAAGPVTAGQRPAGFSAWRPVRRFAPRASLRSCLSLLTDRPAAQPLIRAAVAAVARAGYAGSAAHLAAGLQQVLVSADPLAKNSVIVTLLTVGKAYRPVARGAPTLHRDAAYTAVVALAGARVTAVARGGF
jgi:hypothetical protein